MDPSPKKQVVIVGGGAAGFFAAIACAEASPAADVTLLEKTAHFLSKVRISGGGRCNVTHSCFDPRELAARYPRGGRALIGAFQRFQARDTVAWFEARGVRLKTEPDGRIFPTTDSSATIVDCLTRAATSAGVRLCAGVGIDHVTRTDRGFVLTAAGGQTRSCDRLLLATGGARSMALAQLAADLGHGIVPPVPSLFTFHVASIWLRSLAGIATECLVSVPAAGLREQGPMLITHVGLSGPAVLRLSAWGARPLHDLQYNFALHVNWLPNLNEQQLVAELQARRTSMPARAVVNGPIAPLPSRLWAALVQQAHIEPQIRWADLSRVQVHALTQQLLRTELAVTGKTLNKDEFVTCGGVRLGDVNFKTMESRLCPGLYFAGELLDIDGITGGFNFQAAWTTGWIAGHAMADSLEA